MNTPLTLQLIQSWIKMFPEREKIEQSFEDLVTIESNIESLIKDLKKASNRAQSAKFGKFLDVAQFNVKNALSSQTGSFFSKQKISEKAFKQNIETDRHKVMGELILAKESLISAEKILLDPRTYEPTVDKKKDFVSPV